MIKFEDGTVSSISDSFLLNENWFIKAHLACDAAANVVTQGGVIFGRVERSGRC
jgi:hypothetical protein